MGRGKQILTLFAGALSLLVMWAIMISAKTLLMTNENNNLLYLPENVNYAIRIDGRELAEETLFSIFLESKDEQVLELILEKLRKQDESEKKFSNLGIDYLSDIIVFQIDVEGRSVEGFLFNVSNPGLFKKGFEESDVAIACSEDVGVVLLDNRNAPVGEERLTLISERMLSKPSNAIDAYDITRKKSGTFFETFTKGTLFNEGSIFGRSNIHFGLSDLALFMNGRLELKTGPNVRTLNKVLEPKGFHFSGTQLPQIAEDSISRWLGSFGLKSPEIASVSFNLLGTNIVNHSSGFFIVPQMELLIETKKDFSIEKLIDNRKIASYFDFERDSNAVRIQDQTIYFKQLDEKTFYLGITENPTLWSGAGKELLKIRGNLKPWTNISGGGLVSAFLELIPEYRASKVLSDHINQFDVTIRTEGKYAYLKGRMLFKQKYHPLNELIKFLLLGEFLD
ncbi:MAG: hypothetical protein LW688_08225 [Cryomorphaceae bacterium]|nr:hypothetical protein [Cryomorphaceae bacterium]